MSCTLNSKYLELCSQHNVAALLKFEDWKIIQQDLEIRGLQIRRPHRYAILNWVQKISRNMNFSSILLAFCTNCLGISDLMDFWACFRGDILDNFSVIVLVVLWTIFGASFVNNLFLQIFISCSNSVSFRIRIPSILFQYANRKFYKLYSHTIQ